MFLLLGSLCVLVGGALIMFGYMWGVAVVILGYVYVVWGFMSTVKETHETLQKPLHKGLMHNVEHKSDVKENVEETV